LVAGLEIEVDLANVIRASSTSVRVGLFFSMDEEGLVDGRAIADDGAKSHHTR
jgi:hypothetical protein